MLSKIVRNSSDVLNKNRRNLLIFQLVTPILVAEAGLEHATSRL